MPLSLTDILTRYLEALTGISLLEGSPKFWKPFIPDIVQLSKHLSRPALRKDFVRENYMEDPRLRKAYLLYYLPVNLLKIHPVLDELALSGFFRSERPLKVLDLGSGPGTMIIGLLSWLKQNDLNIPLTVLAIDQSSDTLRLLKSSVSRFWDLPVNTMTTDLNSTVNIRDPFDLILAGNLLNELLPEELDQFQKTCRNGLKEDGFLLCIEPALKDTSRLLLNFRNTWLENGGYVYAPCCTHFPCPALNHPDDWCHHDVPWVRPEFIRYIDEQAGLIKKSLKFSYLILSRRDIHLLDFLHPPRDFNNCYRVVSELFKEKGRYRLFLCNDTGRYIYEKNKREHSPENSALNTLCRYDIVQIGNYSSTPTIRKIHSHTLVQQIRKTAGKPSHPNETEK